MDKKTTIDPDEIAHFSKMADEWWDESGKFAPLHKFNPARLGWIRSQICQHFAKEETSLTPFKGLNIVDIGCGGGLVSEPIARLGADVTAIDASEKNINIAQTHAAGNGLDILYKCCSAEALALQGKEYDVVLALEIIEHVSDPDFFVASCAKLVKPGGMLFLATLNRTLKSYAFGILGVEYILRWLPVGTHQWAKFIKPSELAKALRDQEMELSQMTGFKYLPFKDTFISDPTDLDINYMLWAQKPPLPKV